MKTICILIIASASMVACKKSNNTPPPPASFSMHFTVDGVNNGTSIYNTVSTTPLISFKFTSPVESSGIGSQFTLSSGGTNVPVTAQLQNQDSVVNITPTSHLNGFVKYTLVVSQNLKSSTGGTLSNPGSIQLTTGIDSTDKFPQISDSALLTLVQQQTFKYFWDFGHPVSGMARERTSSGDLVTTGGSGFGVMSMLVAVQRNFITRAQALTRIDTIVSFLTNKASRYH
ncbi:MAG TPA: Ig-like domain-containing protein, partial [Puia sp.]|nr:Ig-like domain-containing protein [Puia sp.]